MRTRSAAMGYEAVLASLVVVHPEIDKIGVRDLVTGGSLQNTA